MLFRTPPEVLLLLVPVLIFALCFHEFAHALEEKYNDFWKSTQNAQMTL